MNELAATSELGPSLTRLYVQRNDDVVHVTFSTGQADGAAVRELYEVASLMVTAAHLKLLVDFTGVSVANSGAMGMMVTLKKRCMAEGAQFHIAIPNDLVRQQFEMMNLHLILNIFSDAAEAMDRFKS